MSFDPIRRVSYESAPSCLTGANVDRDLRQFHLRSALLRNRSTNGPGILEGLEISAEAGDEEVVVSPGVALDGSGRLIVLADGGAGFVNDGSVPVPTPIAVPLPGSGPGTLVLTVEFAEGPASPIDPANPAGCKQIEVRPRLRFIPSTSDFGPDAVPLAEVEVGGDGKVAAIRPGPRRLSGTVTGGLNLDRAAIESPSRRPVASLAPMDSGGLRLDVPAAPLEIAAGSTTIRGSDGNRPALAVEGTLSVSGDIQIDRPGQQPTTLEEIIAALRGEIAALKEELTAPTSTQLWVHGSQATKNENLSQGGVNVPFELHTNSGGATLLKIPALKSVEVNVPIPTLALTSGRPARLKAVTIRFFATNKLSLSRIIVSLDPIGAFNAGTFLPDTTQGPEFTLKIDPPKAFRSAISVFLQCKNASANPSPPFPNIDLFFLEAVGVEFEA